MSQDAPPAWFTQAISFPYQTREVEVAGCTLRYLVWGEPDKPPLVLVHGGAAHAMWWSAHACELSRHYYVIAPDLSGHGDSGQRDAYPIEMWAEEVMAIGEDAAAGRAPVLVGHSMGGRCMARSGWPARSLSTRPYADRIPKAWKARAGGPFASKRRIRTWRPRGRISG
jgi:pimeloyl-ACP methyl ester carboxylesterase